MRLRPGRRQFLGSKLCTGHIWLKNKDFFVFCSGKNLHGIVSWFLLYCFTSFVSGARSKWCLLTWNCLISLLLGALTWDNGFLFLYFCLNLDNVEIVSLRIQLQKIFRQHLTKIEQKWVISMKYETPPIHLLSHGAIPAVSVGPYKARFKRCISRVPNLMQMNENNRFSSLALNSGQVKCDVWTAPEVYGWWKEF